MVELPAFISVEKKRNHLESIILIGQSLIRIKSEMTLEHD